MPDFLKPLDMAMQGTISRAIATGDLKAGDGTLILYKSSRSGPTRVALIGIGKDSPSGLDQIRKASVTVGGLASSLKARHLAVALESYAGYKLEPSLLSRTIMEGIYYGAYRYDEHLTNPTEGQGPTQIVLELITAGSTMQADRLADGLQQGAIVGTAVNMARTWANRPANLLSPDVLATIARDLARRSRALTCKIHDHKWLARNRMGGILAVGAGSQNRPCLIELRYRTRSGTHRPRIGLVGKAVTFDSGGISIKPSADMDQMKLDKTGGAVVLATMQVIDQLGLDLAVIGLIPAVENLPSGTSYRPGDIITTYAGKTVEVVNTDAEGRLILADALAYAGEQGCKVIVDIATLTGACMVALGKYMAGLMGNDQQLIKQIQQAATLSGEPVWPLPCSDEYAEEIKGKVADLRNTGSKWGGACTAAAFLRQFVGKARWVHLDIAGVDLLEGKGPHQPRGASGFGVSLLRRFLEDLAARA
jgi:leucyl aminopeptidase